MIVASPAAKHVGVVTSTIGVNGTERVAVLLNALESNEVHVPLPAVTV